MNKMYRYRISKYDPQYRDQKGIYRREEWNSYSDIGKIYYGKKFSKDDYIKTEIRYCNTIFHILQINKVKELVIENLEKNFTVDEIMQMLTVKGLDLTAKEEMIVSSLKNGDKIDILDLQLYLKLILRECFWCELVDAISLSKIEFGYDYYVYIYSKIAISKKMIISHQQNGIFIEKTQDEMRI